VASAAATALALSQDEAFVRIRLLRSPNIGPVSFHQLLRRFGSAVAALDALPDLAARGKRQYRAAPASRIEDEVAAVRKAGARYLFHDMADYPALLREIDGAPPILIVRGDLSLAAKPCVSMVDARNASAAAVKLARDFASALAGEGFTVVSGLARGIDGAAHEGALGAAMGGTVGVIASGIDITYPPQHEALQERVASEGLLIAEEAPGTSPRGQLFPKRNRIVKQENRFWLYLGMTILSTIGLIIGFILLIIPGIILAVRWSAASGFLVSGREGVIDSLKASWEATRGNGLTIFLAGLVLFIVLVLIIGIITGVISFVNVTLGGIVGSLLEAFTNAIMPAFGVAIYCLVQNDGEQLEEVFS